MSLGRSIQYDSVSQSVYLRAAAPSTGVEKTVAYNAGGITAIYVREGAAAVSITPVTQTAAGAWTSGGFIHVGGGLHRFDIPDAALASSGSPKAVHIVVSGLTDGFVMSITIPLVTYNPYTAPTSSDIAIATAALVPTAAANAEATRLSVYNYKFGVDFGGNEWSFRQLCKAQQVLIRGSRTKDTANPPTFEIFAYAGSAVQGNFKTDGTRDRIDTGYAITDTD